MPTQSFSAPSFCSTTWSVSAPTCITIPRPSGFTCRWRCWRWYPGRFLSSPPSWMPFATGISQSSSHPEWKTCVHYLAVWFLLPIAFFSLSQSKLPGYILPAIPAGTILLANFIWRREQEAEKPSTWLGLLHALLSAAMLVAAFVVPFRLAKQELTKANVIVIAALAIVCLFCTVVDSVLPGLPRISIHHVSAGCHCFRLHIAGHGSWSTYCNRLARWRRLFTRPYSDKFQALRSMTRLPALDTDWASTLTNQSQATKKMRFPSSITWLWPPLASRRNWNIAFPDVASREWVDSRPSTWIFILCWGIRPAKRSPEPDGSRTRFEI